MRSTHTNEGGERANVSPQNPHPPYRAHADAERKRQAHLQARAALAGIALHRLADGTWLASRWNLTKALADHEVEGWLARVGAP